MPLSYKDSEKIWVNRNELAWEELHFYKDQRELILKQERYSRSIKRWAMASGFAALMSALSAGYEVFLKPERPIQMTVQTSQESQRPVMTPSQIRRDTVRRLTTPRP